MAGPIADYWQMADTGDFTGDGRADILWRDDAGRVVLWEMNGADIVDNTLVADVLPSWQLEATAPTSTATAATTSCGATTTGTSASG